MSCFREISGQPQPMHTCRDSFALLVRAATMQPCEREHLGQRSIGGGAFAQRLRSELKHLQYPVNCNRRPSDRSRRAYRTYRLPTELPTIEAMSQLTNALAEAVRDDVGMQVWCFRVGVRHDALHHFQSRTDGWGLEWHLISRLLYSMSHGYDRLT